MLNLKSKTLEFLKSLEFLVIHQRVRQFLVIHLNNILGFDVNALGFDVKINGKSTEISGGFDVKVNAKSTEIEMLDKLFRDKLFSKHEG